jgi:hypothetical protein
MNTDLTDLVHESIARLTDGERIPAGLAHRAARHNHHRRTALGMTAATSTAIIAAVAVLVTTVMADGFPRRSGGQAAQTTAYVLTRTERALAAAAEGNRIEEIHATGQRLRFTLGTDIVRACVTETKPQHQQSACPEDLNRGLAPQAIYLSYRGQFRETGFSAAGRVLWDASITANPATLSGQQTLVGVGVDYPTRTWWSNTIHRRAGNPGARPRGCGRSKAYIDPPIGDPAGWSAQIHNALRCGTFRVAGHQRIGGVNTIKIVAAERHQGHYTLWVNPSTYLPVRAGQFGLIAGFQWLAPTKPNLAALHVRVPDGFRKMHDPGLPAVEFAG